MKQLIRLSIRQLEIQRNERIGRRLSLRRSYTTTVLMLATTEDELSEGGRFEEQRSVRVKRRRQQSSQQRRQQNQHQNQQQREASGDRQRRQQTRQSRAPLMIGKSSVSGVSVVAAKQIFKKSVFLIDNVSTAHNADDIRSFVSGMSIDVISCFEVRPRRRRNEEEGQSINQSINQS